ncbi:MAG: glycyl-radical enzyme activating protein [Clostridia bacterium]|nr:glycyl-radical enzyme activating protein [Clostridia bacterium]
MKGRIFAIKRFAVHDGDGIRTTVFFKGCPLRCVWCHNPESISFAPQVAAYAHKCVGCGECLACPEHACAMIDGRAVVDREKCISCGKCAESCVFFARELFGKDVDVNDLADELCADKSFFESSGGGVTLSGGECLAQPEFALALLKALKEREIHTAVDTCGYVSRQILESVIPYVDTFLYDIKAIDPEVHKACTGRDNQRILSNFDYLCQNGCRIEVRIPYVVGCNDGEIDRIGAFLAGKPIRKVTVLQYHDMARSKYASVAMEDSMPENLTDRRDVADAVERLKQFGLPAISGSED